MTSISDFKEYYSIASEIIKSIHDLIDNYVNSIPEAKEFLDKCDQSLETAKIHGQRKLEKNRMNSIIKHISEAKNKSDKIVKDNMEHKNLWGKSKYNIILLIKAGEYRKYFKDKSEQLSKELIEIRNELDSISPQPPTRLPLSAMLFWNNHFQDKKSVTWNEFITQYTSENNITEDEIERKFKKYLCNIDNNAISIYTFYSTCTQFSYPIMLPVENHVDTMKLAELIMNLTKELYSPEFGRHWGKLLELKSKAKINNKFERKLLYENLAKLGKSDDQEWFLILHQYRSTASSFFQRYMMLWRIGNASQEMLDNVDIPGKSRIYTFIQVCETIDEVNYKEILKLDTEKSWEKGRPQVYDFLRAVLNKNA